MCISTLNLPTSSNIFDLGVLFCSWLGPIGTANLQNPDGLKRPGLCPDVSSSNWTKLWKIGGQCMECRIHMDSYDLWFISLLKMLIFHGYKLLQKGHMGYWGQPGPFWWISLRDAAGCQGWSSHREVVYDFGPVTNIPQQSWALQRCAVGNSGSYSFCETGMRICWMKVEVRRLILDSAWKSDVPPERYQHKVFFFLCLSVLHGGDKTQDFGSISRPPITKYGVKKHRSVMESFWKVGKALATFQGLPSTHRWILDADPHIVSLYGKSPVLHSFSMEIMELNGPISMAIYFIGR